MPWCEHCRSHYPEDHYDNEGDHKIGMQWGVFGGIAWKAQQYDRIMNAAGQEYHVVVVEKRLDDRWVIVLDEIVANQVAANRMVEPFWGFDVTKIRWSIDKRPDIPWEKVISSE